ncbi:alpha/beta hydrolase fold domain-containing protein [Pricia sp.]|uniref:alpha/beta hydrolase fold domain-containing protein n=1 Tax=Pricia sp. TaxID=2268138 RepID=UPI0035930B53
MKAVTYILVLFLAIGCLSGCTSDDGPKGLPQEPGEPLAAKNLLELSYGADPEQVYDIYLPKNGTLETKVIILVHGGGWNSGDKYDMVGFKDYLREQLPNLAIVNMNYRLADGNNPPFPMQINDISSVVNDLKNKQDEYQISTELGFLGASAGGHLSLLWSYAHDQSEHVNMVCSVVGPTNLADEAYLTATDKDLKDLILQFGTDIETLKSVSPFYRVESTSPPTILFYGARDPLIPNSQGIALNDKLEELNVKHEFTLYANGGHGWIGLDLLDTSVKLKAFIEKHL